MSASRSFENLSLDDKRAILAELMRERALRSRSAPLSFAQERLWFLDQLEPGSAFYNVPSSYRLQGEINIGALERSLNEIVRRHEALRTRFQVVAGQPLQIIEAAREQRLEVRELGHLGAGAAAEAMRLVNEEGQRPFDLANGPLLRSQLLRLGAGDYVLLVTMHHIVSDGWSAGVFLRELSALYEAYSQGRSSPLAELPIQYADYAVWQRQRLQGEFLAEQLGYWREQLQGLRPLLELPADGVRPAVQRYRGAYQSFQFGGPVAGGIRELSEQAGVTMFMTLLAAFQLLLWRYTGERDVAVGTPIAGRTRAETEGLIGFFVNTLVLRTELDGRWSFLELLARVRAVTLGAYAHQELPFEKLVEELQPERNLSYNPLFQVMFVLQTEAQARGPAHEKTVADSNSSSDGEADGGVAGQLMLGTAKFDLTLSVQESGGVLVGAVEYNTDLFSAARVGRLIGHYEQLLKSIVSDPQQRIGRVELLSSGERAQLLEEWAGGGTEVVRGTVLELFAAQVAADGQRVALVSGEQEISYQELEERSNQWAHYLRSVGVGAEIVVGICLGRSVEQVVAVLGVLKSGAAYLPLEPGYPAERLALLLAESGARLVITSAPQAESLPSSVEKLVVETVAAELSSLPVSVCPVATAPDNLAYVAQIHENSSTVAITHAGLCSAVRSATDIIDATPSDRVIDLTSTSRDSYLLSIFASLLRGARLHLPSLELDGSSDFAKLIHDHRPSILVAPVARFLQLRHEDLSSVRAVVLYGENFSPRLLKLFPEKRFVHIRELPCATLFHISCDYTKAELQLPAAYDPPANVEFHVLDEQLQLVPIGVNGELFIGDVSMRGVPGRADLTAASLVPNPFSKRPGASLYDSGYRVRRDANGKLNYLGTSQEQIDIAGHNVRLREVEAVIARQSNVLYTTFRIDTDEAGRNSLVAYILPDDTARSTPALTDLKDVPEYLRPSEYLLLSELPLTVDGEIDRQALPLNEAKSISDEYVAPRNALESILAGIWMDVLEVDKLSVHDNFFRLGGHSLLATMANFRVSDALGIEVPVTILFEAPTIADFASRLSNDPQDGKRIEQVAQLLVSMDDLSEDAVKALLAKAQTSGELK